MLGLGRQEHPTPWNGLLVGDMVKVEQDRVSLQGVLCAVLAFGASTGVPQGKFP